MSTMLMVQGCTSDAGKTTLVAGLCRYYHRLGFSVAPFKPQNMALNSAVTKDDGEIGRAQALQAQACGIDALSDMNPILIKPSSDTQAQIVVQGKALTQLDAVGYQNYKAKAMDYVLASFERLITNYDRIIVEGAGSPAEINLRANDIANMGFAEKVDCPVILIADIDKGGVFAHLVGTLDLLSESERDRVIGFVINKFRGDLSLLKSGLDWLEAKTGLPVFGVLPMLNGLYLDAEDAISTQQASTQGSNLFQVVVPVLPRISNHTDFDALRLHPEINCQFIGPDGDKPPADLIILPGSKSVMADLEWLREQGWEPYLKKHLRYGGKIIGICGGMQMLGEQIADPFSVEKSGTMEGLGLLSLNTVLAVEKCLIERIGSLELGGNTVPINGYEIHHGETKAATDCRSTIRYGELEDGWLSEDGQIFGTYLHGLFDRPEAQSRLLEWAGITKPQSCDLNEARENSLNRLADALDEHLDMAALESALVQFDQRGRG